MEYEKIILPIKNRIQIFIFLGLTVSAIGLFSGVFTSGGVIDFFSLNRLKSETSSLDAEVEFLKPSIDKVAELRDMINEHRYNKEMVRTELSAELSEMGLSISEFVMEEVPPTSPLYGGALLVRVKGHITKPFAHFLLEMDAKEKVVGVQRLSMTPDVPYLEAVEQISILQKQGNRSYLERFIQEYESNNTLNSTRLNIDMELTVITI